MRLVFTKRAPENAASIELSVLLVKGGSVVANQYAFLTLTHGPAAYLFSNLTFYVNGIASAATVQTSSFIPNPSGPLVSFVPCVHYSFRECSPFLRLT